MLPTGEALTAIKTWAQVLTHTKLKAELWKKVATIVGEEDLDDFPTISVIEPAEYAEAAKQADLNPVARARLNLSVNIARVSLGAEVVDLFPAAPPPTPSPAFQSGPGSSGLQGMRT